MDVILIPGLWLDAASWDAVLPSLRAAGHTPHPLTMPGVGAPGPDVVDIAIDDWVAAVVAEIDRCGSDVALVGHSGGGNVAYGALDARPGRVARIVFLDTFPPPDGSDIWEFPVVDGVIPFPGWDFFDEGEVADLDEDTRVRAGAGAASVPPLVPATPLRLRDERRRKTPATLITTTVPGEQIRAFMRDEPWAGELAAIEDLTIVQLHPAGEPTGHWPQFSIPDRVGQAIVDALG
ncbi:alpha/beta fold hydrolase [Microbacterium thalassium]|uniref:Pimeloyl-ACP methyl ester carboxylesterase n=1 Tax=Microbacterium thalassium TaxID=362649 RepID=A0A7X0KV17_9MICO|nr:alpha/beta hydrolase [Microbacterium thalassium]MBB6391771.1 pimeloyl-ACP methyl ester carboxylesterase [Microbacterium thalassium]